MCECQDENSDEIFKNTKGQWVLRIKYKYYDEYNYVIEFIDKNINYCPYCGRKLK